MIKRLIHNTIISTIAFGAAAILGLIVIPVIIRTWGVTEFGLIVITRLLLPTGMMAVLDLGLSEVATQVVARAREHRDWNLVGRQLSFLTVLSILLAVALSGSIWLSAPYLAVLMKVDAVHVDRFTDILHYTALANLVLVPALVWEGTVKGFERYNLLRFSEFTSTLAYVVLTVWASTVSALVRNCRLHLSGYPRATGACGAGRHHHRADDEGRAGLPPGPARFAANCCIDACCCSRAS